MSAVLDSIRAEYQRYQVLAEGALDHVPEAQLATPGPGGGNSLTTIAWHVAGNLRSRFTAFLTEDGEKAWPVFESPRRSQHMYCDSLLLGHH